MTTSTNLAPASERERDAVELSWTPAWATRDHLVEVRGELGGGGSPRPIRFLRPRPGAWAALRHEMEAAGDVLRAMSVREIVQAIDVVAARWCDAEWPVRKATTELIVEATGFSREAVARSLDVELRNYRAASLWKTLRRELGDPRVLDALRPDTELAGWTRAFGPRSMLAILTGNVPGLPALAIVRSLLVKAPLVVKVASGEPAFAAAFARSLHDVDPRLGEALVITYWARDDRATLKEAVAPFDTVMVYGGDEVCATVRPLLSSRQRYVEHGHKLSVGIVTQRYLAAAGIDKVAADVARDMSVFNQHACIAPQAYFVEGSIADTERFGAALAKACEAYAEECPLGELAPRDAASHQLRRADLAWRAAGDDAQVWYDRRGNWSIVVAREFGGDTAAGNRILHLVPVADLADAAARLKPYAAYLQNVGLGATRSELFSAAETLGALGVSRISQPGRMVDPSMMWRHDGKACVAELVRWCDIEMHAELDVPGGGPK